MKLKPHYLLVLSLLFTPAGCSWFSSEPKIEPVDETKLESEVVDSSARAALKSAIPSSISSVGGEAQVQGVEVLWQAPLKTVEVYHLSYGFSETALNQELTIPVDKLERIDHPAYGPVYRYVLRDVPTDKDVFVTLRAENRIGQSQPSKVMRIAARQ